MGLFGPSVGPAALFDEVCRYHEIDKKNRQLLQNIIKKYNPPRPAEIFILPDMLRKAIVDADFTDNADDLQKLYDSWF